MNPSRTWTLENLLSERCVEVGNCQQWPGGCNDQGHPVMSFSGKVVLVRRLSWALHKGLPLSDIAGVTVWGTCGDSLCIAPACTKCGTRQQMFDWMVKAGRMKSSPGKRASCARIKRGASSLTMQDAREIRAEIERGVTRKVLAERYKKSDSLIDKIWYGKVWREQLAGASIFSMGPP
jgi:hypothetical protein